MTQPELTMVFWNTWLKNQDGTHPQDGRLQKRLDQLVQEYRPDIFGLNEVLVDAANGASPVLDHLAGLGYRIHFAPFSPHRGKWLIGSAFVSRVPGATATNRALGEDGYARRQGYPGHTVQMITADVPFADTRLTVVVNYLTALYPQDLRTHARQSREYARVVADIEHKNLVIGGDFNDFKYRLPWPHHPDRVRMHTGSLRHPTWLWNGQPWRLVRANYDHIIHRTDGDIQLERFEVLERSPSDHTPLLVTFSRKHAGE